MLKVEDALCPDQFFLPAVEAVQARPSNNLVQLDGAVDQEDDDQDHAHAHHHQHASQSVCLNDFLGMVNYSRRENQDRLRQEREKDLQEIQNLLNPNYRLVMFLTVNSYANNSWDGLADYQ